MTRAKTLGFLLVFLASSLTARASVRLPLEFHKQEHELSCEAAAVATVLHYYGVRVGEAEVIKRMPVDSTPRTEGVWGDPDVGFVGDIDGEMAKTGYGIHWNALARLASNWKRTVVIEGGKIADLTSNLDEGRPVIAWGIDSPARDISWSTPSGRKVFALSSEHTRVVYGYKGKKSSPDGFWVMDPLHGPRFWKAREFLADWDSFGRKGIVLYR